MKKALIVVALLAGSAAIAQDYPATTQPADPMTTPEATEPIADPVAAPPPAVPPAPALAPASGAVVAPSNADPEHDARGIAVISDPAVVPAGFNGVTSTGVGGPLVDPATGETIDAADDSYPNCTAEITDNCLQTYERGRSPQ